MIGLSHPTTGAQIARIGQSPVALLPSLKREATLGMFWSMLVR